MFERLLDWHRTLNGWVWGPVTMTLLLLSGTVARSLREFTTRG